MKKIVPQMKKRLIGFLSNESGSITRDTVLKGSMGALMITSGIMGGSDIVNAHVSTTWNACAFSHANVGFISSPIGDAVSWTDNGHFSGSAGSSTHANIGHANYDRACSHTSHGSHGSCGGGCW